MKVNGKAAMLVTAGVAVAVIVVRVVTKPAVPARYVVATGGPVLETILANGRVAGSRVTVLSMMRSGVVGRIMVREGAAVAAGDTLVVLDNSQETNDIARARSAVEAAEVNIRKLAGPELIQAQEQLAQARAAEQNARARLERLETLFAHGAVSQQELDNARTESRVAESRTVAAESRVTSLVSSDVRLLQLQRAQAEAALRDSRIALSRGVLRAPDNGRVVRIHVNVGQLVTPAAPVVSFLAADTTTHVELQVDESQIGRVRVGQRAIVSVASRPDLLSEARVRDIVPIVDAARGTATVRLALDSAPAGLLPDQTVSAQIVTDTIPNGVVLEQRFVVSATRPATAMVLRAGRAVRVEVSTRDAGGGRLAITAGIAPGDTVLFAAGLTPGRKVRLIRD